MTEREHSSNLEDIKERRDLVEYNLSLTNYILENINKVNIRQSDGETGGNLTGDTKDEDKKKEMVLFEKRIKMILALEKNDDLDIDMVIKKYLPILNRIKLAQEGEIKLLSKEIRQYYGSDDTDKEESIT